MSTQELTPKKPQIGKWMLIAAIPIPFVAFLLFLHDNLLLYKIFIILYLLLSCAAAIFYLMRKEQAAAARVWGILGGFALILLPPSLITIPPFTMAIGGAVLALKAPKLAGKLMLAGAITSGAAFLFLAGLIGWLEMGATGWRFALAVSVSHLLAVSFLIPGGILALTSRKGQPASKKMAIGAIAALFAIGILGIQYLIEFWGYNT